jgi:GT2 family glycosyltransferase
VGIPTYSEKKVLERNLQEISKFANQYSGQVEVMVVDQGSQAIEAESYKSLRVVEQDNLGGSGGFARIFYEFLQSSAEKLVIFDADVHLDEQTLIKLVSYSSFCQSNQFLGTQMLNLKLPLELQIESETLTKSTVWPVPTNPNFLNVNHASHHVLQADLVPWWGAVFTRNQVAQAGFPAPFFLHFDDIEFSMRLTALGFEPVFFAGLGVWHEPFDGKGSSRAVMNYFDCRNSLAAFSAHGQLSSRRLLKVARHQVLAPILAHDYTRAEFGLRAIRDWIAGPESLSMTLRDGLQVAGAFDSRVSPSRDGLHKKPKDYRRILAEATPIDPGAMGHGRVRLKMLLRYALKVAANHKSKGEWVVIQRPNSGENTAPLQWSKILWINRYGEVVGHSEFNANAARSTLWRMFRAVFAGLGAPPSAQVAWKDLTKISEKTYSAIFEADKD